VIDPTEFQIKVTRLHAALTDKMNLRGKSLEAQIRRAGRRLPRHQRRAAAIVLGAQDWMCHPKLARVLDRTTVNTAFADLHAHLDRLDPKEARRTALLRLLGGIVLNLMALGFLIYALMHWI